MVAGLAWPYHPYGVVFFDRLIAALTAYAFLWTVGEVFFRLKGVEGLGIGDAKLAAAMGAWLGWRDLPLAILISSLAALVYLLVIRAQHQRAQGLPFAPALSLGFLCVWALRTLQ